VLRVGLIGAGQVAERHAAAFAACPDAVVTAVADPDRARGERLAADCGAAWFASTDELLAAGADAVVACVPHDLHLPVAVAAAEHGAHILLEKPIANSLEEADAILEAADRAGVRLMVGFVHRFRTEVLEASRLLREGAIGEPVIALDRFCSLGGPHPPAWVWSRAQAGGGVLMYGGIHAIDRLLWLIGDEATVTTAQLHQTHGFGDVEDGLVAMLRFSRGASAALVENSPPYGRPGGWATDVFGTDGALRIQTGAWVEHTSAGGTYAVESGDEGHFERQAAEFVAAIRDEREPSVTGRDGRDALAVALAIYRSGGRA
jgi:predicted dehydrogenase